MPRLQLYDQLLQFPLFEGMSRDDLAQIVGHTKFDFVKGAVNKVVIAEGRPCDRLYFLLAGTLSVETRSDDHAYRVVEELSAPLMLQPEAIFGYYQAFTHTYIALSDVSFITLDKEEVRRLTEEFLVFRLNLLNYYSTQVQKLLRQPWRQYPEDLTQRIIRFLSQHCIYPAGRKMFHILMTRLADEVGDSRRDVSGVLNQMEHDGLLILHRGRIEVPQMERLLM